MNEQATAQFYGRMLGILSGLFALLQVLVSVSSVLANQGAIAALQHSTSTPYQGTIPTDLGGVGIVLLATYGSAVLGGLIMIGFAWYAGRLTALSLDRRAAGGMAGFWVALWSGAIWLAVSLVGALLTHADGTITGVFTSSPGGALSGAQVTLLLVQNGIAAAVGLGFGALAGLVGSRSVRVSLDTRPRMPLAAPPGIYPRMYPGVYPQQAYPTGPYPPAPYPPPPYPPAAYPPPLQPNSASSPGAPNGSYPQAYPPRTTPQGMYPPEPHTQPYVPSRPDPMRYPAYSSSSSIPSPIAPPGPTQPLVQPRGQPDDASPEASALAEGQEHVPPW